MASRKSKVESRNGLARFWLLHSAFCILACSACFGCLSSGSAADRRFEQEFREFRYGIYRQFPDLSDTLVGYQLIMNRVDSLCADFLALHRRELDGYFERSLQRLPVGKPIDPAVYEHKDSLVWGDTVSLDLYFAEQKALLTVMNCSPEFMANSYRAMFLTRSLGTGEYGKYQLLNTLGSPRLSRRAQGRDRIVLVTDTWLDVVEITLAGSRGNYRTVRLDRYVRRRS